jgi:general secretion pathway protein I
MRSRGFTLIEVLVALVIVAFGMGAVLSALTSAADSALRLREKTLGEWIALNQIATARLALSLPKEGSSEGDVEFANQKWHWRQQVVGTDIPGLLRLTVDVRRAPAANAPKVDDSKVDWLASAVGFRGDAMSVSSGALPSWAGTGIGTKP